MSLKLCYQIIDATFPDELEDLADSKVDRDEAVNQLQEKYRKKYGHGISLNWNIPGDWFYFNMLFEVELFDLFREGDLSIPDLKDTVLAASCLSEEAVDELRNSLLENYQNFQPPEEVFLQDPDESLDKLHERYFTKFFGLTEGKMVLLFNT